MTTIKRRLKEGAKRALFEVYERGQHLGVDILPRHFYSQVPDLRLLRKDLGWRKARDMSSLRGHDIGEQLEFMQDVCAPEVIQAADQSEVYRRACEENGEPGYGPVEAVVLYAFIRRRKPARVVQVGCGVSTAVILAAAHDAQYSVDVCCIDPFPTQYLKQSSARGEIRLIAGPAQQHVQGPAGQLTSGDLLFVDSTHTVVPGSEVNALILDVLPRLASGVDVHFHDITFPFDYPRRMLDGELFYHSESTLLQAFLSCNDRYSLLASLSMLHYAAADRLKALVPSYNPAGNEDGLETRPGDFPSALYMRRT